ncbi:GtrA family protein, partial [Corynebacterium stationis]
MTSEGAERLAKSNSLRGQSTKFAITGGISAVIDAGLTWIFQIALALLGNIEARSVGFFFGTLTAYLLNRRWTFRAQPSKRRFAMVALT